MIIILIIVCYFLYTLLSNAEKIQTYTDTTYKKKEYTSINLRKDIQQNRVSVVFFDVETNGLSSSNSVLSISAAKTVIDYDNATIDIIDTYERFYYPIEDFSEEAISVNHLDAKTIERQRKNVRYSRHFKYDQNDFLKFIDKTNHFVAHNIEFDRKFLNFNLPKQFCTMKSNTNIVKIISPKYRKGYKWPKLIETAQFYNLNIDEEKFHASSYDVIMTIHIFKEMLNRGYAKDEIYNFLFGI